MARLVRIKRIDPPSVRAEDVFGQSAFIGVSTTPSPEVPMLERLVRWAYPRFRELRLVLGDHLNRHNLARDCSMSLEDAGELAFESGAALRASIAAMLLDVAPRCHLISSLEIFRRREFGPVHEAVKSHFESHSGFREVIQADVESFEARRLKRGEQVRPDQRRHSIDYVLEELAMFALLVEEGAYINLYAGSHSRVVRALANREVEAPVPALARQVCVQLIVSGPEE